MPLVLLIVGGVLLLASVRGDPQAIGALVQRDFTGERGFASFAAAFLVVGAVGFVPGMRPLSQVFLALMVVSLILAFTKRGGKLFERLGAQWTEITSATPARNTQGASQ